MIYQVRSLKEFKQLFKIYTDEEFEVKYNNSYYKFYSCDRYEYSKDGVLEKSPKTYKKYRRDMIKRINEIEETQIKNPTKRKGFININQG